MTSKTTKVFLFKNVSAQGVKVSHSMVIGLPSLTGIYGLGEAFAGNLALALGLHPTALLCSGVLFSFEDYQLVDGVKKGHKPGKAIYEAIPAAWSNMTVHLGIEVTASNANAADVLAVNQATVCKEVLSALRLCKGTLQRVPLPVNLDTPRMQALYAGTTERTRAIAMLPSFAQVVTEAGAIVEDLRSVGLPLMEGLIAASLPRHKRPSAYREFYDDEQRGLGKWKLVPVQDGYLKLDDQGLGKATRQNYVGEQDKSYIASPTLSLVRLQSAASLRANRDVSNPFWSMRNDKNSFYCVTN